jgi:hypothetical protein
MQALQAYHFDHEGWEQEHRLVLEQRHPHSARVARGMHFAADGPVAAPGPRGR